MCCDFHDEGANLSCLEQGITLVIRPEKGYLWFKEFFLFGGNDLHKALGTLRSQLAPAHLSM